MLKFLFLGEYKNFFMKDARVSVLRRYKKVLDFFSEEC